MASSYDRQWKATQKKHDKEVDDKAFELASSIIADSEYTKKKKIEIANDMIKYARRCFVSEEIEYQAGLFILRNKENL